MRRSYILFSAAFILLLLSVPVLQVVYELRSKERVQMFDVLRDTFLTPGERAAQVEKKVQGIQKICDSLRTAGLSAGGPDDLYEPVEELLADAESALHYIITPNRHITDSAASKRVPVDTLLHHIRLLQNAVSDHDVGRITAPLAVCDSIAGTVAEEIASDGVPGYLRGIFHAFFRTTVFNKQYLRAYEEELEERSVVARVVRSVMQVVRYRLLKDPGEKAVRGKEGWLFYRQGVEYCYRPSIFDARVRTTDYNDEPLVDDPLAVIVDFRDQLSKRGIDLLVVVVPGKASIYPDMVRGVPSGGVPDTISPTGQFIDSLRSKGIAIVDLFRLFRDKKNMDTAESGALYLSRDTHWKPQAVVAAADAVAKKVRSYRWYSPPLLPIPYQYTTVSVDREGDVGVMTDLSSGQVPWLRVAFPKQKVQCQRVIQPILDKNGAVVRVEPYRDDFRNARLLLLGDSFSRIYQTDAPGSAGFIAHMAASLSEPLASLVSDGGASTLVREKLARNSGLLRGKKLVIWEFVERDIRYGAFGWKKIDLP